MLIPKANLCSVYTCHCYAIGNYEGGSVKCLTQICILFTVGATRVTVTPSGTTKEATSAPPAPVPGIRPSTASDKCLVFCVTHFVP